MATQQRHAPVVDPSQALGDRRIAPRGGPDREGGSPETIEGAVGKDDVPASVLALTSLPDAAYVDMFTLAGHGGRLAARRTWRRLPDHLDTGFRRPPPADTRPAPRCGGKDPQGANGAAGHVR